MVVFGGPIGWSLQRPDKILKNVPCVLSFTLSHFPPNDQLIPSVRLEIHGPVRAQRLTIKHSGYRLPHLSYPL